MQRYIAWITCHARAVVAAVAVATVALVTQVANLRVDVNPDTQLPQDHPYVQALGRLNDVFGEKNLVFIGLFPNDGNAYSQAFLAKLAEITERIEALPGLVRRTFLSLALPKVVDIRAGADGMVVRPILDPLPRTAEAAAAIRRVVFENERYVGTLAARDGSALAIVADFDFTPPLLGYPEIREAVEEVLAAANDGTFTSHVGGPAIFIAWLAHYSERMFLFFPLAVLVIGLVHYEAFRTLQAAFLPLLTALLAMLWSLGLLGLLGVRLDPFNVTTPILILAVAAGHAVQMLKRFYEELAEGGTPAEAVRRSVTKIGPVMIVAALIAALSFLSLVTFRTVAIRNFGLFTALGILSALVLEMTLIPAVRSLLPAPSERERSRERRRHVFDRLTAALSALLLRGGHRKILAGGAIVAAAAIVASLGLRVDSSFRRQFSRTATVRADDERLNAAFGGTSTLVLLVTADEKGAIDEPVLLRAVDELQRRLEAEPSVGKTVSFVDFVKRMHAAMNDDAPSSFTVPDSRNLVAQYLLLYSMSGSVDDFDGFVDPTHTVCVVRAFLKEDSTLFATEMIERLRPVLAETLPPGYRVEITGSLASTHAMNEVMVHGKIRNIVQIAVLILVVSSLVLRSFVGGLFVATPLALSVLTNFGVMGALDIPLDIGTSAISAMAVGIGADYAIYLLFRLREEVSAGKGHAEAVVAAIGTSGKAILFVSSAIAAGYLTLSFSGFGYHIRLGTLVAFAMLVSSLASLTLLPALALALRPRFLFARPRPLADGGSGAIGA